EAAIPQAKISVLNTQTGLTAEATTTDIGTYVVPLLPVGVYSITVKHEGFKTETKTGITLTADQIATVNFALAVGEVSQEVQVSANAELITTSGGTLGQVIEETAIVELPLNGRNPAELVLLTPGTVDVLKTGAGMLQGYTTFPTETGASA